MQKGTPACCGPMLTGPVFCAIAEKLGSFSFFGLLLVVAVNSQHCRLPLPATAGTMVVQLSVLTHCQAITQACSQDLSQLRFPLAPSVMSGSPSLLATVVACHQPICQ